MFLVYNSLYLEVISLIMFRDLYLHKHDKYTNEHNIANIVIISSLLTQRSIPIYIISGPNH